MNKNKLKWYIVNKNYINYLRMHDKKVGNIDYDTRFKPYIGILIRIKDFNYYVPISSVKPKHYKMKEDMDFIKLVKNNKIISVLNLNNMIPILHDNVSILKYNNVQEYRNFNSEQEKKLYISFLSLELTLINKKMDKIRKSALRLYNEKLKNPASKISKRCCDFKLLEEKCILYK